MRPRSRNIAIAGVLVLIIAGFTGWWLYLAGQVSKDIQHWAEQQRAAGFQVSFAEPQIGGYPFAVRASFEHPVIAAPGEAWRWSGPDLVATMAPWDLTEFEISFPGRHELSWKEKRGQRSAAAQASSATLLLDLDSHGDFQQARFDLGQLLLEPDFGPALSIGSLAVAVRSLGPSGRVAAGGDLGFEALLQAVVLPEPVPPLGPRIERMALAGALVGRIPSGPAPESLAAWRDAGGTLEIRTIDLAWDKLSITGAGTFVLDEALQPKGALNAVLRGHLELLDALQRERLLSNKQANYARLAMSALTQVPAGGGPAEMRVPLMVQDRKLTLGPFLGVGAIELTKLPEIKWQ